MAETVQQPSDSREYEGQHRDPRERHAPDVGHEPQHRMAGHRTEQDSGAER